LAHISFTSFDQNWPLNSLCHFQNHNYTGVLGWLHPKSIQDSAVIAQPIAQEITGSTKIPQLDNQEVQAIVSQMKAKDQRIDDLTRTNNIQVTMIAELRVQLDTCLTKPVDAPISPVSGETGADVLSSLISSFYGWLKKRL
jgi:hypothetical protein